MQEVRQYPCAYVPDGYNETAYLAGIDGLHPPILFTYRPMKSSEGITRYHAYLKAEPSGKAKLVLDTVVERVISWDILDHGGNEVPCTPQAKACITQVVMNGMALIAMGVAESARPPDASPIIDAEEARVLTVARERGVTIAEAREFVNAGNS